MPIYRISRLVVSDAVDIEADSPEAAIAILSKSGIQSKGEFSQTVIEEVLSPPKEGYRQETSQDLLATAKAANAGADVGAAADPI